MSIGEVVGEYLELHNGDHMSQQEFHRIYEQMPESFRAELIGGIVYVASPLAKPHAKFLVPLSSVLFAYESATAGTESGDNGSIILADDSEPQPDLFLRVLPKHGGRSGDVTIGENEYVQGPPELVVEIAGSSHAIDLHRKRDDFAGHGVLEYVVLSIREMRLHWFDLASGEHAVFTDGVMTIRGFAGLWIDVAGVFSRDHARLMTTLGTGLATPEHAAFVAELAARRRG